MIKNSPLAISSMGKIAILAFLLVVPHIASYAQGPDGDLMQNPPDRKPASSIPQKKSYQNHELEFLNATLYEKRGDVFKAQEYYRKALAIRADFLPAATNLAISLFENGKQDEAMKIFSRMATQHSSSPLATNNLGLALLLQNQFDQAITTLHAGSLQHPYSFDLHFNLGTAYYKNSQYQNARQYYLKALALSPRSYIALNNLGCTFIKLRDLVQAEARLQAAVTLRPRYSQGYYNLAYTYWLMNRKDKAEEMNQKALERNPNHHFALELKKILFAEKDKPREPKPDLSPQ